MDVATLTMDRAQAREKLRAYRAQLHRRADAEYEAAAAGYQALAQGRTLINLRDAIASAPCDEKGRPRLAIARADRKQVCLRWEQRSRVARFDSRAEPRGWDSRWPHLIYEVDMGRQHESWTQGYALVPMVPADVRPDEPLKRFHILWEVEAWADRSLIAKPDVDPFLLRHLAGDLYVVEASWDLTELERAVMAGRAEG